MTAIADIYDAIVLKLGTNLPTFKRIPNPYSLDENTALLLRKGYGIAIGAGTNTERYVGCLVTWQRDYTIGIVTQVVNTENDTLGRAEIEKDLIDAHDLVLKSFETDPSLGGKCIKAVITDDSGIEYISGDKGRYLALELTLRVEYQETST